MPRRLSPRHTREGRPFRSLHRASLPHESCHPYEAHALSLMLLGELDVFVGLLLIHARILAGGSDKDAREKLFRLLSF